MSELAVYPTKEMRHQNHIPRGPAHRPVLGVTREHGALPMDIISGWSSALAVVADHKACSLSRDHLVSVSSTEETQLP
jgi:hypothetical protein